ncbi:MAG: type II secretion system secretin GspD [Proteobacteria bacterium]|nr:type II secretion system secretin GspD [Pseudomonadota bacterium]
MDRNSPPRPTAALVSLQLLILLLALCGLPRFAAAQPAPAAARQSPSAPAARAEVPIRPGEPVTLNFENADIDAVARTIAAITGRNVVVDPRVHGTITLVTDKPVSPKVAVNQFLAALRLQGYTMIDTEGLYKVVPEAEAKLQSSKVSVSRGGRAGPSAGSQVVTQIFKLNFAAANNLVPVLKPLISPNNTINVDPGANALIITDYADNLNRIARIIAALDVSNGADIEIIPLKNAIATDVVPLVQRLIEPGGTVAAPGQAEAARTALIAEPRSNSLIMRAANPARAALVRSLVQQLDRAPDDTSNPAGNIHVVYLKNADAVKLAATLRAAISAGESAAAPAPASQAPSAPVMRTAAAGGAGATPMSTAAQAAVEPSGQPSLGGQIQADPATNSLIISAPEPLYRQLRAVIDKLDGRRAQVLVESLIAEVNTDKAAQFGIQWQALLGNGGANVGVLGTNFTVGGTNIFSLANAIKGGTVPATSAGGNLALAHQNGAGAFTLGALANFLQSTGDGNVLSTPTLLTLDNEEAKIVVGQNVPFVTGQYTNANTSNGSVNPFTTVERKDVGLTLRVKPQISEDGTVKMSIYQEVSSIQAGTLNNLNGPTTNKRSIESTVLVDDGSIVVLGGLLQDNYSANQQKVPGLGDVPLVGSLFRSDTRERTKTNLMVFLRPVIVRSADDSRALSLSRYDLMREVQQAAQPSSSITVPVNSAPVMAPAPSAPGQPAAPQRPVPAPLMTPGLSGTWGSGPGEVGGASNVKTAPPTGPTQVQPHGETSE